jgi:hypothetical protein
MAGKFEYAQGEEIRDVFALHSFNLGADFGPLTVLQHATGLTTPPSSMQLNSFTVQ